MYLENFIDNFSGILIIISPPKHKTSLNPQSKKRKHKREGNSRNKTINKYFKIFLNNKWALVKILILSLILTLMSIISTFYFKTVLDFILPDKVTSELIIISLIFIGVEGLKSLLNFFRNNLIIKLQCNMQNKLSEKYIHHVVSLPNAFLNKKTTGDIISRINDASIIINIASNSLVSTFIDLILILLSGRLLFLQNKTLFQVCIIPMFLYCILAYLFFPKIQKRSTKLIENQSDTNSYLIEILNKIESIKCFNKIQYVNSATKNMLEKLIYSLKNSENTINSLFFTKNTIQGIYKIIILWLGFQQILSDKMTIGELFTFNALLAYFFQSIENIINLQPLIQEGKIAFDRVQEILDHPSEKQALSTRKLNGNIEKIKIKNLGFSYTNEIKVLENVSLEIYRNETIAFVGNSGSGKSTLAKLLVKLYEFDKCSIYINDEDILNINNDYLREKILYLTSDTFFLKGTLWDNLCLGKKIPLYEVENACQETGVTNLIKNLPGKYNYKVIDQAKNFSMGQKQMLGIARALLHKPEVIIFDETFNNIDKQNKTKIYENLKEIENTKIFITHSPSEINYLDKIYLFNDKKVKLLKS